MKSNPKLINPQIPKSQNYKTTKPKKTSLKTFSLIFSVSFTLILALLITIPFLFEIHDKILFILISILFFFIIVFISIFYGVKLLIFDKFNPIYKIISNVNKKAFNVESTDNEDIISSMYDKVKKWSDEKKEEIKNLKQNEKYRKEFLGNVSHELKTPLFNIQGLLSTLIDGGLNDEQINMKYLTKTEKNVERLISIVKDLETITRLNAGELKLKFEKFDIHKLIHEVVEEYEFKASVKQIILKFKPKSETKKYVNADRYYIYILLCNLINNSIIYGKKNGYTLIYVHELNDKILVEVQDNGIGIDPKNINRIFERFYRVDKVRSKKNSGTGLGLAIVKHIIKAHNESINVKSQIDAGTTFSFFLQKIKP